MPDETNAEEQFRARVLSELATCGVSPDHVSIQYEDELQDFSVRIGSAAPKLSEDQAYRVAGLSLGGLYIFFEDADANSEYQRAAGELLRVKSRNEAVAWLASQNLLETLPLFDPAIGDLASYAKRLEEHCGLLQGSILEVYSASMLTIRRDGRIDSGALRCISHAVAASNVEEHGIIFGIIGEDRL